MDFGCAAADRIDIPPKIGFHHVTSLGGRFQRSDRRQNAEVEVEQGCVGTRITIRQQAQVVAGKIESIVREGARDAAGLGQRRVSRDRYEADASAISIRIRINVGEGLNDHVRRVRQHDLRVGIAAAQGIGGATKERLDGTKCLRSRLQVLEGTDQGHTNGERLGIRVVGYPVASDTGIDLERVRVDIDAFTHVRTGLAVDGRGRLELVDGRDSGETAALGFSGGRHIAVGVDLDQSAAADVDTGRDIRRLYAGIGTGKRLGAAGNRRIRLTQRNGGKGSSRHDIVPGFSVFI